MHHQQIALPVRQLYHQHAVVNDRQRRVIHHLEIHHHLDLQFGDYLLLFSTIIIFSDTANDANYYLKIEHRRMPIMLVMVWNVEQLRPSVYYRQFMDRMISSKRSLINIKYLHISLRFGIIDNIFQTKWQQSSRQRCYLFSCFRFLSCC